MEKMKENQIVTIVDWYLDRGLDLIPIRPDHGKRPLHTAWETKKYYREDIILHFKKGHNVGFRLGPTDVVIDVDPRNGGDESLIRLKDHIRNDLSAYSCVKTGGDGLHYYCKKAPDQDPAETIPAYPGIEVKKLGRQVIIPGSVHPQTGNRYEFIFQAETEEKVPYLLLELYKRAVTPQRIMPENAITPEELTRYLDQLPAEEYPRNDTWFPVLAASYHSTGGAGLDAFLSWWGSAPGHDIAQEAGELTRRWNSLSRPVPSKRSVGTLIYEVDKYKSRAAAKLLAEEVNVDGDNIKDTIAQIAAVEHPAERQDLIAELAHRSHRSKTDLKEILRHEIRRRKTEQKAVRSDSPNIKNLPNEIAEAAKGLVGKDRLIHAADQNYWVYKGTHWERMADNLVSNLVLQAIESYHILVPDLVFDDSKVLPAAQTLLRAKQASELDLLGARTPQSVVNAQNGEIWVDSQTGEYVVKDHDPKHGLTSCLPIEYSPSAICNRFESFLEEVFEPLPDAAEVARHVWEVIGYTLQPCKDLPGWYLLQGTGQNGKTVLLQVLGALLGDSVLFQGISQFDTSKNSFAMTDLVGKLALVDDDVRAGTVLPDDFLKKIAENKQLTANPKFGQPFQFRSCATVFLAANSWPQSRDLSLGMRRRVNVIPFRRHFSTREIDRGLATHIIDRELPGVLRKALEALRRLRCRGHFDPPKSCHDAMAQWIGYANQSRQFLDDTYAEGGGVAASVVWADYQAWCVASGIKRAYSRHGLLQAIRDLGYEVSKQNGVYVVSGLTVTE